MDWSYHYAFFRGVEEEESGRNIAAHMFDDSKHRHLQLRTAWTAGSVLWLAGALFWLSRKIYVDLTLPGYLTASEATYQDPFLVKDNGLGIGIEDRQLLCKRGYTSKIRTFEDLTQLGGTFLGFRGEALASIAELSDNLTITTRVDGELVGTLLKFKSNGKLTSSSSAAHGTGTTVRVSNFLQSIPVRKQTALKQATKTLSNIRKLLFEYAFARPSVRFQFKVLKSTSDLKANWSFAPCTDANDLNLLASKIVGKDVASQCKQVCVISEDGSSTIDALLFDKEKDITTCGGIDCYFSIDGRPLTVERGIMRDLNKIYKSYVASCLPEGIGLPRKIFLLLKLHWSRGSYDVNVEPAKNEVMFENSQMILDLFDRMCKTQYGDKIVQATPQKNVRKPHIDVVENFNLLLSKNPLPPTTAYDRTTAQTEVKNLSVHDHVPATSISRSPKDARMYTNMDNTGDLDMLTRPSGKQTLPISEEVEDEGDIMNPHVTNPFVLAKMNTRLKPRESSPGKTDILSAAVSENQPDRDVADRETIIENSIRLSHTPNLLPSPSPSPERDSYQNPGPPNRPWKSRKDRREDGQEESSSSPSNQRGPKHIEPTMIDAWTRSINSSSPINKASTSSQTNQTRRADVNNSPTCTNPIRLITSPIERPSLPGPVHQTKFRPPFKKDRNVQASPSTVTDHLSEPSRSFLRTDDHRDTQMVSPTKAMQSDSSEFEQTRLQVSNDLEEIMDFEHRKKRTILQHRERTRPLQDKQAERRASIGDKEALSTVLARPENEGLPPTPPSIKYASKFGSVENEDDIDIPPQPNSSAYTQNPHFNRYRKALRDLDERAESSNASRSMHEVVGRHGSINDRLQPDSGDIDRRGGKETISTDDPRGYLISQASNKQHAGSSTKMKRSATVKLPFETIASEVATFRYIGVPELLAHSNHLQLMNRTKALRKVDSYVHTGSITSELIQTQVARSIIQQWQTNLEGLVDHASAHPVSDGED